jgi:molybdopterin-guanine dinucleotide biosynthesis protein A
MYHSPMPDVSSFILAGGRSSRMGSDKALLPFDNQTLLQRTLRTASDALGNARIVGSKSGYGQFGDVVEDIYPGCGPLGGIHAALSASKADLNLMLSVDMPLMTPHFLKWLAEQSGTAQELIVVPNAAGGPQPLCAIYRRSVLPAVEQALKNGEYKIGRLFSQVPTRIIKEQEIVAAGFSAIIFQNVNTPEEYDRLLHPTIAAASPGESRTE